MYERARSLRRALAAGVPLAACLLLLPRHGVLRASNLDEFKVKREEPPALSAEFAHKPALTREGDRVTIEFETRGFCDVTVAIEDQEGRIVRHLASGVLGPNAPEPFQKGARKQTLVWDGKDDRGRYLDGKNAPIVRVALGLQPRFERTLFWSPHKRIAQAPPLMQARPEGVYVFEGMGTDHLRLFDHDGDYVRTVYPFPARRLDAVRGLKWQTYPGDGKRVPVRADAAFYQCTLLTSGDNAQGGLFRRSQPPGHGLTGRAADAMAIRNGFVGLLNYTLNRLDTDGGTGGLPLDGPKVAVLAPYGGGSNWREQRLEVSPKSAAISPDGRWLYLAGYLWDRLAQDPWYDDWRCLHGVLRMPADGSEEPAVFVGSTDEQVAGTGDGQFRCVTSVACDAEGRVYVADYMNDRIQVYSPDARLLKTIPAQSPAHVAVHQRTGHIYCFSWMIANRFRNFREWQMPAKVTHLGPFENPAVIASRPLPLGGDGRSGPFYRAELDSWTDPPSIWLVADKPYVQPDGWSPFKEESAGFETAGIRLLVEAKDGLRPKKDFGRVAREAVARVTPARFSRQRLYVNPPTGRLYVGEDLGFCKSFKELVEIDPETGRIRLVPLPFDAEDLAFDLEGHAYLRTRTMVCRYDPGVWREVPFDYGEEHPSVGTSSGGAGRRAPVQSGIPLHSATLWHHGGLSVSARGHVLVCCTAKGHVEAEQTRHRVDTSAEQAGKPYAPRIYPGRLLQKKGAIIHVWDQHGQLLYEDAVPGLDNLNGAYLDARDAIYVMSSSTRMLDETPYPNTRTGTVMKFQPRQGRVLSSSAHAAVPLPEADRPTRVPDLGQSAGGGMTRAWVEGAEWMYGGAGFDAMKHNYCSCSNSRFAVDHFGRSFVPEVDRSSIAVLDTNGNLILRVGRYGNVDDGLPMVREGGPPAPRSLGGDEVSLVYAPYVTTHTDRRLFAADVGNARIVSVKLDYHATERLALKDAGAAAEVGR